MFRCVISIFSVQTKTSRACKDALEPRSTPVKHGMTLIAHTRVNLCRRPKVVIQQKNTAVATESFEEAVRRERTDGQGYSMASLVRCRVPELHIALMTSHAC